ncbi:MULTISPECIES: ABC transporter ATP-binding protein [unclassified Gemella]|uniref:ABC transporter ATP-binding protein n=1 Tax=unclassified Gemella TaxID=2624949 RepID=UPI001C058E9B|nr:MULTISPECIES: ABC transporter ATP-binding protein [unclassified Gemella]MBU0279048.1 ABC transporter ATP-binding protein [Gemella sp. zg-1178]QWQ38785.1 ABC transporter ATP-binding protein [Gemella sp. zg-570]
MLLEVKNLKKIYTNRFGGSATEALKDVNFSVNKGEFVAIMGESGSGKTTLLNIMATFDRETSGEVIIDGKSLATIKEKDLANFRKENLGFVFQDFNLLDNFTLKDNILLPLVLAKKSYKEMDKKLEQVSKPLGLTKLLNKYPYQVSGGQKQRVAVARAIITQPKIILADEPTGALDSKSTENLLDIFEEINRVGHTIMMVTHSVKTASRAKRVLFIKDGIVFHEIYKGTNTSTEMYQKITEALSLIQTGGIEND